MLFTLFVLQIYFLHITVVIQVLQKVVVLNPLFQTKNENQHQTIEHQKQMYHRLILVRVVLLLMNILKIQSALFIPTFQIHVFNIN